MRLQLSSAQQVKSLKSSRRPACFGLDAPSISAEILPVRHSRQPEQVIDPAVLAPSQQRFSGESAVGAHQNAQAPPARPDTADNVPDLVHRAGGCVDVRATQLGCEQRGPQNT
jgi:hypothetical protein